MKREINIICSIIIGIIALFGAGMLTSIQFVHATSFVCNSNCQGFLQGCKDGKADLDSKASAHYHYDPNTIDQEWIDQYKDGYSYAYNGPYSYCKAMESLLPK